MTLNRVLKRIVPLVGIPMLVLFGALVFDEKRYLFVSCGVALLSVVLFMSGYDKRLVGSRRAVLVAVMTALSVIGRLIPVLKPTTAVVVLSALYLGPEAGFLVGSLSALVSNIWFGQGPWTPFQMLALGLIALAAGYASRALLAHRWLLVCYGVVSGVIYSLVMDVWTVLWYNGSFSWELYGAAVLTALPHTALYALSNLLFLWWIGRPIGEKLSRIRLKYGI